MNDLLDDNNFFIFDDVNVRISPVSKMSFRKKPSDSMHIVQICLWIIDSGCSKHMTGNRALLTNFVEKFLGTVRFGNNIFAVIAGYGEEICLWIIDSGCSKHMTGNRALLTNFVEKLLGTVRFGNNDFAVIAGYGDENPGPTALYCPPENKLNSGEFDSTTPGVSKSLLFERNTLFGLSKGVNSSLVELLVMHHLK
nr:integrase, catalytic region, zinc finger, CCHC-type, peptidase aspartic, catalytic [Tanacetum cinerariifolium]